MKIEVSPYAIWYALSAWSALGAASSALSGGVPWAVMNGLVAVAIAGFTARSQARLSRTGEKALRAELARLVDERAASGAEAWLHRDACLLFKPLRPRAGAVRARDLMVIDEDLLRDVNDARLDGGGRVAATYTAYRVHPAFPRVLRHVDGVAAMVTAGGVEQAGEDEREPWGRRFTGAVRLLRSGRAFAEPGELADLVAQFRAAEPVAPDA